MRVFPGRAEKLESAVAILILFILIAVAVGVYRYSILDTLPSMLVEHQASSNEHQEPFAGLVTGDFSPAGNAETYDTDNLYEKINGKAPMYQDAGFVLLTTQRFADNKNPDLGLELYLFDMGNARNAFSVYSRQKRADGVDLPDPGAPGFAYKTSNAVYISHGRYYVEMIGFSESQELIDAMKGIALKLVVQLPIGKKDRIPELEYFPKEGMVAGSRQLQLKDAFGFEGLTDTYSAKYKTGDKAVTIFLSRRKTADEAEKVAKNYRDFFVANDAKVVTPDNEALKSANASVLDFYGSTEIVFATGVFVGGVHEADDKQAAQEAAEVLIGRLKEIND